MLTKEEVVTMATDSEEVLTVEAIRKLKHHKIFIGDPDEILGCWTAPRIWIPSIFPSLGFHHGKLPSRYDRPVFLVYLGFRAQVAFDLFFNLADKIVPSRLKLMESVKTHISSVCSASVNNWAPVDSLLADTVMEEVGLLEVIKDEVRELHRAFERSPLVFQRYFDENHDKNYENLKLVDFMQELVHQRMQKLMALNEAALRYLP